MADTGIVADDFSQILSDMGRVVSYQVVTKTTDGMSGTESSSYGTASDKTVVFFREDTRYIWDKEGLLQVGDAYIIAPTSIGVKRGDEFTIDSIKYFIESVIRRHVTSVSMQDFCTCFVVTN